VSGPDVFFAIGITGYRDPALPDLPDGADEIDMVAGALRDLNFAVDQERLIGPSVSRADVEAYCARINRPATRAVLYWTGHGLAGPQGAWLCTSDTVEAAVDETTAISPASLARLLTGLSEIREVLLILDCCGSGVTGAKIAEAMAFAPAADPVPGRIPPVFSVISATYGEGAAFPLDFAQAVVKALRNGSPSMPWPAQQQSISPQDLADAASSWLVLDAGSDDQRARSIGIRGGSGFFVNPGYDPAARDVLTRNEVLIRRQRPLDTIAAWRAAADRGLFLVTGSMGTGKSALVTQLVAERYAARSAGPLLFALSLTGQDVQSVGTALAPRLGIDAPAAAGTTPESLVAGFAQQGRGAVIIMDAIDEALAEHRLPIVNRLLLPLSELPGVHVVVTARAGARSDPASDELTPLRTAASGRYDLDADPDAARDIARHVRRILVSTPHSPYTDADAAVALADRLAALSHGVFYLADLVAGDLARQAEAIEAGDPALDGRVRSGLAGAIQREIGRRSGDTERVMQVLAPLAWAAGDGVPVAAVWPAMATALLPDGVPPVTEEEIAGVLALAGTHVRWIERGGTRLHQVGHQAFADFLRERWTRSADEAHLLIARALRPGPGDWPRAAEYVREHLVDHAERGLMLSDLFRGDADFMAYTAPRRTLAAASRLTPWSQRHYSGIYLRAAARLIDVPPRIRVFLLRMLAAGRSAGPPVFSVTAPCETRWSTSGFAAGHHLVRSGPDSLGQFTMIRVGGQPRAVVAGESYNREPVTTAESGLEVWDPRFEVPMQVLMPRDGGIHSIGAVPYNAADDVLIVAYVNQMIEARLPSVDRILWRRPGEMVLNINAVWSRGMWLAAATSLGMVALYRTTDGERVHVLRDEGIVTLIGFVIDGHSMLCLVAYNSLKFFSADTFQALGEVPLETQWMGATLAIGKLGQLIVGLRSDGLVEARDCANGRVVSISQEATGGSGETIRQIGSDGPLVTSDGGDVEMWSMPPIRRFLKLPGNPGTVTGIGGFTDANDAARAVTAGDDGSIRVWGTYGQDLFRAGHDRGPAPSRSTVFAVVEDGRPAVLVGGASILSLRDAATGEVLREHKQRGLTRSESFHNDLDLYDPVDTVKLGGDTMVLVGHNGDSQMMWNLRDGSWYGVPTPGTKGRSIAVRRPDGPLLVTGGGINPIGVFTYGGERRTWLDSPNRATLASTVIAPGGDLALLDIGDAYAVYDPATGGETARLPRPDSGVLASAVTSTAGEIVAVVSTDAGPAWLATSSGRAQPVAGSTSARAATVLSSGTATLFAVADLDRVLLVRPSDGAVVLVIPLLGRVHDVASPEPDTICAVVADQVLTIEVSPQVGATGTEP
jgi:hypothetical protein